MELKLVLLVLAFIISFSKANYNNVKRNPKVCPSAMLSATSGMDIKGQMQFYQDSKGDVWLTGIYQYGFQDPKDWDYCWTIQNACGDIVFNLTSDLGIEFVKDSGCNGYDDDNSKSNSNYSKRYNTFSKRNKKETCEIGPYGTKPWVIKLTDLSWDCNNCGFKYQTCSGKDIYKDMVPDYSKEKQPDRLRSQGKESGLYLVIDGQSKCGKRDDSSSAATINVNDAGGE
ncbi:2409_t:CDS:2, partial [Scutellospora calospora]